MKHSWSLSIILMLFAFALRAQIEDNGDEHHSMNPSTHADSTVKSIRDFVANGVVTGNIRNFFMASINEDDFYDYYANAWGGRLGYTTAEFHGFQVGVQGIFVYNVTSNNIARLDPVAGKPSQYEAQWFDLQGLHNRNDLDRIEELFLYYNFKNSYIEIGKLNKNTPLLNPQDSRMKPYVFEGVWADIREWNNLRVQLGYFWRASPRSITDWHQIGDAIGLYSNGYYTDGTQANYLGQLETKGLAIAGADYLFSDALKLSVWNYYLDQILNTVFIQLDYKKNKWIVGLQYLRQDPISNGGKVEEGHSYYDPNQNTNLVSSRLGLKLKKHLFSLNFTHIAASGRFVFPREFGREQFYTTLPRMRLEGLGNTNAMAFRHLYSSLNSKKLQIKLEAGLVQTPEVYTYTLNKYNQASYAQSVVDLNYRPSKIWKGLAFRLLYVYRKNLTSYPDPALTFNQSNLHHLNFITNISF